jgi:hypothetical protein
MFWLEIPSPCDVEPFNFVQGTGLPQCREAIHKTASLLFLLTPVSL